MNWAMRRRLFILIILLAIAGLFAFLSYAPDALQTPTCTDQKQNGDESGIDCGGVCQNLCLDQTKDPVVLWTRSFKVTEGLYTSVAYIENQNAGALERLPYEFRLYDDKGVFVKRVQGTALIPPLGRYAIVEPSVQTGTANITRTTIVFAQNTGPWKRIPKEITDVRVSTGSITLDTDSTSPRLSGVATNQSAVHTLFNTQVVAILYGESGNALAVSKTLIPTLLPTAQKEVFFTWPTNFEGDVIRFELIPIIDVFALSV